MGKRSLPSRIQARLTRTYGLVEAPAVDDFIRPVEGSAREALLLREEGGEVEVALHLPRRAIEAGRGPSFDELCQVVEGVSHFVYVAERARRELPATQLELELQAEIDKYVLLALGPVGDSHARPRFEPRRAARIRATLFDSPAYLHAPGTETGERYRVANDLAARYARRIELRFCETGRFDELRAMLRRFYAAGQTEKIELARAA